MYCTAPSINCTDADKIRRKRDALRSELTVLWEARRRLIEADAVLREHAAARRRPSAAADGQQLAGAGAGDRAGSSPQPLDDFYPLDDSSDDDPEPAVQWQDQLCHQLVHNSLAQPQLRRPDDDDDDVGHLGETEAAAAASGDDLDNNLLADSDLDDDDDYDVTEAHIRRAVLAGRLHVPRLLATRRVGFGGRAYRRNDDGGGGFGAVPASAAAIAGLEKRRYDGGGGDSRCVICIRDYRKGDRLRVMACEYKHRFHRRCLKKWLSCSHLCPLCRHALPTQEQ